MRRIAHTAILIYIAGGVALLLVSLAGPVPFWVFFALLMAMQFAFSQVASNMNSLSMELAGRGGRYRGGRVRLHADRGRSRVGYADRPAVQRYFTPNASAFVAMGLLVLGCALIAEKASCSARAKSTPRTPSPLPTRSAFRWSQTALWPTTMVQPKCGRTVRK